MKNPWIDFDFQGQSQLHPLDAPHVLAFNSEMGKAPAKRNYKLSDVHAPLPYFGSLDAKVVVLLANPGLSPNEIEPDESLEQLRLLDSARRHQTVSNHFIYLDQAMRGTEGNRWWNLKLRSLISETSIEAVHKNILVVEFHPYHSVNFSFLPVTLPTQNYSFSIVNQKVDDGATFVMGRHQQGWLTAVPKLADAERVYFKSRNAAMSQANLSEGGFDLVRSKLL
jgi:hypothetical protein